MYNNPMYHNNFFPYQNNITGSGIKRTLFNIKKINWSNLLNNTQKTLNVINQAIPVYYQVKPIWSNAKTMFRMVSSLKNDNDDENDIVIEKKKNTETKGPVFFI